MVSGGELERVLRVEPSARRKMVFSGVGKSREEMRMALRAQILLFNVESQAELWALAECAARLKSISSDRFQRKPRRARRDPSLYFDRTAAAQIRSADRPSTGALPKGASSRFSSLPE